MMGKTHDIPQLMLSTDLLHFVVVSSWPRCFNLNFSVRRGSVLASILFAVYVDDIAELFSPSVFTSSARCSYCCLC